MLRTLIITNVLLLIAVQESRQAGNDHEHFLHIEDLELKFIAMPGDNVTLPCKFRTDRSMELTMLKISWSQDGKEKWTFSMDSQKDEARLEELNNGNANFLLSHIQREDGGNYTCNIKYRSLEKEVTRTVIVNDPAGHYSTLNSQNDIVSSLHSTPPSQDVEDPRTHSTPPSRDVGDPRPHSTPPSRDVGDPRPHSTPPSRDVEDPSPHSTPPSRDVTYSRPQSTPPSRDVGDPRPYSTPPSRDVDEPRPHSTPPSRGVGDPRPHSTPPSRDVDEPRPHSTPPSRDVKYSRPHSIPLLRDVEEPRRHSTKPTRDVKDPGPHYTPPLRDVENHRPPSSRQDVESSPPFTPGSKETTGGLGSPMNTDEFRTAKITVVTAVLSVSWCLAFLIFYYLPKLH